jgi:ABC-2 type transport system permease protein
MKELLSLQARELWRDGRYFWFALLFPYGMLGMFLFIGLVVPQSEGGPDFKQLVIPMALFLAVTSSALTVTAGPLAALRSKGTLRLLGTTPLGATRLLTTHMLVRVAMMVGQSVVLLGIAVAIDAIEPRRLPALFGVTVLGLALFGSIGYLIGGRISSPETATNVSTLVQLGTLFLSGLTIPLFLLPSTVGRVISYIPSTFFADLMTAQMPGGKSMHPAWLSILVMVSTIVVITVVAVRTFQWDQAEDN